MPHEFWRILHAEYGIVVYPSALTEDIDVHGLGVDVTFTDAYGGYIGKSLFLVSSLVFYCLHSLSSIRVQ